MWIARKTEARPEWSNEGGGEGVWLNCLGALQSDQKKRIQKSAAHARITMSMNDMPTTALKAMRPSVEPFEGVLPGAPTGFLSSDATDWISFMRRRFSLCLPRLKQHCHLPDAKRG